MGRDASASSPRQGPRVSPLALRFLSAFVGVPILIGVELIGGIPFLLLVAAGTWVAMLELQEMLEHAGYRPIAPLAVALSVGLVLVAYPGLPNLGPSTTPALLAIGAVAGLLWMFRRVEQPGAIADWALTLAGALFVGGLLRFAVPLRVTPDGLGLLWVTVALVSTWACDIAAYFVGRAWGRRRLAPRISPGKSVEGAVAGVAAAAAAALVVAPLLGGLLWALAAIGVPTPPTPVAPMMLRLLGLGAVIGVLAVVGDLLESFIKRQCGAKDSGVLIPGHGGVLDRIDSLMLAIPGAYLYVVATS